MSSSPGSSDSHKKEAHRFIHSPRCKMALSVYALHENHSKTSFHDIYRDSFTPEKHINSPGCIFRNELTSLYDNIYIFYYQYDKNYVCLVVDFQS